MTSTKPIEKIETPPPTPSFLKKLENLGNDALFKMLDMQKKPKAARIAKLLGNTPESWLRMQEALDLWRIAQDPSRLAGITPLPKEAFAA